MLMLYSYILYEASGNQCNGCDGHTMVYDADGVSGRKLAILPVAGSSSLSTRRIASPCYTRGNVQWTTDYWRLPHLVQ
jgi:hypothetical protein